MTWLPYLPVVLFAVLAAQPYLQQPLFAVDAGPRQWPNPIPRSPMPATRTADDPTLVGDLVDTPADPILEPPDDVLEVVDVIVNVRHARTPNGHHAIRIQGPNTLTAAQAHQLHIDLDVAAAWVSGLRGDAGYTS